jgi:hypothetical protein
MMILQNFVWKRDEPTARECIPAPFLLEVLPMARREASLRLVERIPPPKLCARYSIAEGVQDPDFRHRLSRSTILINTGQKFRRNSSRSFIQFHRSIASPRLPMSSGVANRDDYTPNFAARLEF